MWKKEPPTAEEAATRPLWWCRAPGGHETVVLVRPRGLVSYFGTGRVDSIERGDLAGCMWAPVPTPDEVAARDAEIARLAERVRHLEAVERNSCDEKACILRNYEDRFREMEREIARLQTALAAEKARGEAMGAVLASIARATDPDREDGYRASAAAVLKAARAVPDAWDAYDAALGHYFGEVGAEHEGGCPEDDTCDCAALVPMHAAEPKMRRAIQDLRDEFRALNGAA